MNYHNEGYDYSSTNVLMITTKGSFININIVIQFHISSLSVSHLIVNYEEMSNTSNSNSFTIYRITPSSNVVSASNKKKTY